MGESGLGIDESNDLRDEKNGDHSLNEKVENELDSPQDPALSPVASIHVRVQHAGCEVIVFRSPELLRMCVYARTHRRGASRDQQEAVGG